MMMARDSSDISGPSRSTALAQGGAPLGPSVEHHQEWRRGHRDGNDRSEQAGRRGSDEQGALRCREEDEAELPALAQQQAHPPGLASLHPKELGEAEQQRRLHRDQGGRHADHEEGPVGDGAQVQHHADGDEEQPEQDRAERLDVELELVPVGRIGEHHAGDEGAERGREVQRLHHRGAGQDGEEAGDHEQLALADASDQAEERVDEEPPGSNEADNRPHRIQAEQPAGRRHRIGRCP
jgi:hypothetical protein